MPLDLERPAVSVVIPTRNEATTIVRAVGPLLEDATQPLEVIIADGGSDDGTRDVVASMTARDPRVRLIDNPARITPEGLNAAIRASRGDVILRMDGHAEPGPGYIAACLEVLETSGAWNVGGRMIKVGISPAGRAAAAAATSPFGVGGGVRHHLVQEPRDMDTVWLGCWPRWVFERVGLFDPEMVQDQDEELNQRILDAGGAIRFDPSIGATYISRGSWRGLLRQHARYGFYKVRAFQKRPRLVRLRHLVPALFIVAVTLATMLAVVDPRFALIALVIVVAWLVPAALFARRVAGSHGTSAVDVVRAFGCMHVGYGAGMLAGSIRFLHRWFIDRRGLVPTLGVRAG